ncbi:MAG: nuclear transport factor 2 family protein, partial [Hyphomonadaceae bacterium]
MTLSKRVQELEDREAIKELCARYAQLVAQGDGQSVGSLYTEDGRFAAGVAEVNGRPALQSFLSKALQPIKSIPCISNHQIAIDGDTAR